MFVVADQARVLEAKTDLEQRIPGAVFFDIDEIADTDTYFPHMLPSPVKFAARVRKCWSGLST